MAGEWEGEVEFIQGLELSSIQMRTGDEWRRRRRRSGTSKGKSKSTFFLHFPLTFCALLPVSTQLRLSLHALYMRSKDVKVLTEVLLFFSIFCY